MRVVVFIVRVLILAASFSSFPIVAMSDAICGVGNKACLDCRRQAFNQWKSINCWSSDRATQQQIQCSQDMRKWLSNAYNGCVSQTANLNPNRKPASEDDSLAADVIDLSLQAAKKIAEKCHIMKEKLDEFIDYQKRQGERLLEGLTSSVNDFMESAKARCGN